MTDLKSIDLDSPSDADLRVIDAAMTEHLFGKEIEWCAMGSGPHHPFYTERPGGRAPYYSTDPYHIFSIAEAMMAKGWNGAVEWEHTIGIKNRVTFRASFEKMEHDGVGVRQIFHEHAAATPALAVCIAALRALEVL